VSSQFYIDITCIIVNLSSFDNIWKTHSVVICCMFLFCAYVYVFFSFNWSFRQRQSACVTLSTRNKYEEEQNQSFSFFFVFFSATQETTCHTYLCIFFSSFSFFYVSHAYTSHIDVDSFAMNIISSVY
jgi:Ca2+/Na+ antiporter